MSNRTRLHRLLIAVGLTLCAVLSSTAAVSAAPRIVAASDDTAGAGWSASLADAWGWFLSSFGLETASSAVPELPPQTGVETEPEGDLGAGLDPDG